MQMKLHAPDGAAQPLLPIARAHGVWLHDTEGRRYVDGISSWWVNLFGHNHPAIRAALTDQLQRLDHVMLAGFTHAPVVELSERLAALSGLGHAFYGSDGASATEIALKMSAHHWRNAGRPTKCLFVGLAGGIVATTGELLPCSFHSICVHGDSAHAEATAAAAREGLLAAGHRLRTLPEMF